MAGLKASEEELTRLGYEVQACLTDFGETAEEVVRRQLGQSQYDCIVIGAGVRVVPSNLLLFEKLINVAMSTRRSRESVSTRHPAIPAVQRCIPIEGRA